MNRITILGTLCASLLLLPALVFAGERTIPVDFFIMIDKSLSMEEPGKFESMHTWVRDHLAAQMLIPGDWVTLYQFYGRAEHLLTIEIKDESDKGKIIAAIDGIKPNGDYTDIGNALDTIQSTLQKRKNSQRLKILYMLTDLKQEAPWSSRYAGVMNTFESPYLAEARVIQHDNWYEITLDMDIQDKVVSATRDLYASIVGATPEERDSRLISATPIETAEGSAQNGTIVEASGSKGTGVEGSSSDETEGRPLPLLAAAVVVSLGALAFLGMAVYRSRRRRDDPEERAVKKQ